MLSIEVYFAEHVIPTVFPVAFVDGRVQLRAVKIDIIINAN